MTFRNNDMNMVISRIVQVQHQLNHAFQTHFSSAVDPLMLQLANNESHYINGSMVNVRCTSRDPFPNLDTEWIDGQGIIRGSGSSLSFVANSNEDTTYVCQYKNLKTTKHLNFKVMVVCKLISCSL